MRIEETKIGDAKTNVYHLDDWTELIDTADKVFNGHKNGDYNGLGCSSIINDDKWSGGSWKDAQRWMRHGWPQGSTLRLKDKDVFMNELQKYNREFTTISEVYGDEVNIDTFLLGLPEHMVSYEDSKAKKLGRVIRIQVNRSVNCDQEDERLRSVGMGLYGAIEALQRLGFSLEVTVVDTSQQGDNAVCVSVPVFLAGGSLDPDRLIFSLISTAFFRRVMFAFWDSLDHATRKKMGFYNNGNYGRAIDSPNLAEADLVIQKYSDIKGTSIEIMKDILKKVGVEVID